MNILLIPNAFKGTLTSKEIIDILGNQIATREGNYKVTSFPFSDGGDGLLDSFKSLFPDEYVIHKIYVNSPEFKIKREVSYLGIGEQAIVESAEVIGLAKTQILDPGINTSYPLGEVINDAIGKGYKKIIVGVGGTCTNDYGAGMLSKLGMKFFNYKNEEFIPVGYTLHQVERIDFQDFKKNIDNIEFTILSDVDNKLLGQNGCTYVYAKQKGATKENLLTLENNMAHLNDIFRVTFNSDFSQLISSGSGGGIGGALLGLMKAKLESGSEFFLNNFKVQNLLLNADVIITGEGKVDTQTLEGKGVMSIAYLGGKYLSKKVIVIGGRIDESVKPILKDNGVSSFVEIEKENLSLEELRLVCKDHLLRAFSKIKF